MHRRDLTHGRLFQVNIEGLRLVDEGATICRHLYDGPLTNLPYCLIQCFDVFGDIGNVLDGSAIGDDAVLHVVRPETQLNQILKQPRVHHLEFARQDTARVDIGCVWLEAFVISEDL